MKKLFLLLSICFAVVSCSNPAKEKHYTILVSLDGFRWDYPQMYDTPYLDKMAGQGVSATMLPSFPSSTFPNHYTLATGLVPDHNGIVNNTFWDAENQLMYSISDSITRNNPDYYLGEPIWATAQKQGIKTANFYWVSSDLPIKNTYPTYYKVWANEPRLSYDERIHAAVSLLELPEEERPQLIMIYIDEPDGIGHYAGPVSERTGAVVHSLDSLMGVLINKVAKLPIGKQVNIIVTSDHGMTEISADRCVSVSQYLKPEWCDVISGNTPTSIFTKQGYRDSVYNALKDLEHIFVWKKEEIPAELNYGTSNRIGDIVVAPEIGWQFDDSPKRIKGAHGFFPQEPDMQVAFRAIGPDFKENYVSQGFINVDIYPMLAHLLQITPEKTDGNFERIKDLFKGTQESGNGKASSRIMSYNIRNCIGMDRVTDIKRVADVINKANADVIAVQEVDSVTQRSSGLYILGELAKETGMYATYAAAIDFQGGKYGLGLLTKEKPISFQRIPLPGSEEERVLLMAEFNDYYVGCTHFSLTKEDRVRSASIILDALKDITKPFILAGDMNSLYDSETQIALRNNFKTLNDPEINTFPADKPDRCIDYIYMYKNGNNPYSVTERKVINEPMASDHLPLYVDIVFP